MVRKLSPASLSIGPKEDPSTLDDDAKKKQQQEIFEKLNLTPIKAKVMVVTLLMTFGLVGLIYSLQAPFFPAEARSKNLTGTENGFVFGVFSLSGAVFSIPAGKLSHYLGSKLCLILGTLLIGTSSIAFGFVTYIPTKVWFLSISLVLRILMGIGEVAISVGMLPILTTTLPAHSGKLVSLAETMFGVGLIIGPGIGGPLYDFGGFPTPFVVIGVFVNLMVFLILHIVPPDKALESVCNYKQAQTWSILWIPKLWFGIVAGMLGGIALSYLEATLESHLEIFHLSGTYTGLIFLLYGLGYGLSSPVYGWLCDRGFSAALCILIGNILIIIGFMLISPAPFLPLDRSLGLILPGLVLSALGKGGCIPPSFVYMNKVAIQKGYPANIETNGMISGIFMFSLFFGTFVGPALGGYMYDEIGFAMGSMVFSGCFAIMAIVSVIIYISDKFVKKDLKIPLEGPEQATSEKGVDNPAINIDPHD